MSQDAWDKVVRHYKEYTERNASLAEMQLLVTALRGRFEAENLQPLTSHHTLKFYGNSHVNYLHIDLVSIEPSMFNITLVLEDVIAQSHTVPFSEVMPIIEACLESLPHQ